MDKKPKFRIETKDHKVLSSEGMNTDEILEEADKLLAEMKGRFGEQNEENETPPPSPPEAEQIHA